MSVARFAGVVGLVAAAWALVVPLTFGALRPGYSPTRQFISELGEVGGPHAPWVNYAGFLPLGAAVWLFLATASVQLPRGWAARVGLVAVAGVGLAYVIAAVCPCDPGCPFTGSTRQEVHNLGGLAEYGGAILGFTILALAFRSDRRWRRLWPFSLVAAGAVGLGFVVLQLPAGAEYKGLWQRLCEVGIFGWVAMVGVRLFAVADPVASQDPAEPGAAPDPARM